MTARTDDAGAGHHRRRQQHADRHRTHGPRHKITLLVVVDASGVVGVVQK
jgi:hypothetical protein